MDSLALEKEWIEKAEVDFADRIGNTPLLRLRRVVEGLAQRVEIFVKAEWFNPSGSVKDRAAYAILMHAVETGELEDGRVLLDSTSGNMGIAYATYAIRLRIPVRLVLPENASRERRRILHALGADLILTDPAEGSEGARLVAAEIASRERDRYYYADQYSHPANWRAHYTSTGPEILSQAGARLTHFVAGIGTSGTLVGTGRYLKERAPDVRLVGVQPDSGFHGIEGLKHLLSGGVPGIFDPALPDQIVSVSTEQAYSMTVRLAKEEGLLVGFSSGAAVFAALKVARGLRSGRVVVICPDSAHKYLQNVIWERRAHSMHLESDFREKARIQGPISDAAEIVSSTVEGRE